MAMVRARGVYSAYSLFSQTNNTGSPSAAAMLAASWKAPMLVVPSPKKATDTVSLPRYLLAKPAPTAMGTPPPTMPLAPSMFRSRSQMCIDPPLPRQ